MRATAALLVLLAGRAGAAPNSGVTAAPVLQIPMGSRALGMGGAFTAVASDVSALYYNPAGLSRLNAHEAAFSFMSGLADSSLQHFAYGGPLPFSGISGSGYASAGASLLVSHNGTIEVNKTNPDGSFLSSGNLNAGEDLVAQVGYSERVGVTPFGSGETGYAVNHFVGVSGKFVRSTLVQQYSDQTLSADAGYLANCPEAGLSLGLSAQNLGGQLRYIDQADPLPTSLRGGVAWQGGAPSAHQVTVAGDAQYLLHERQWQAEAGVEYFLLRSYGVRIGYQLMRDTVGLTAGFGLRWRSRVLIDYAWVMGNGLNDQHRFTLSYRFGGVAPGIRARHRAPFIESLPDRDQLRQNLDEQRVAPPEPAAPPRRGTLNVAAPGWIY